MKFYLRRTFSSSLFILSVCVFSSSAFASGSGDITQSYLSRWSDDNQKLATSLRLNSAQIQTRDEVFKFYIEALTERENGGDIRNMRSDYLTSRAGELLRLQKSIFMSWNDTPQREQELFNTYVAALEDEITFSEKGLDEGSSNRRLAEKRLRDLYKKLGRLRARIEMARPVLAKKWQEAHSLMAAMNQTLLWNLQNGQGVAYQDLLIQQTLTALLFDSAQNHFHLSPLNEKPPVGEFNWAYDFEIVDHFEMLEDAMNEWRKVGGHFPLMSLPVFKERMNEISHEALKGHIIVPVMKQTEPNLDLALGYLPLSLLRFKITGPSRENVQPRGSINFLHDLMDISNEVSGYDFRPLRDLGSSLVAIDEGLKTWKRLVLNETSQDVVSLGTRRKSREDLRYEDLALVLLHFARFGAPLKDDFSSVKWADVTSVVKSLAQDFLFQSERRWTPKRRFFNINLLEDLMAAGISRYQSLAPELNEDQLYPDEIARGLDILVSRLLGDPRLDREKFYRFRERQVLTQVPARVVSTRLRILRDKYDVRGVLEAEDDESDCSEILKH